MLGQAIRREDTEHTVQKNSFKKWHPEVEWEVNNKLYHNRMLKIVWIGFNWLKNGTVYGLCENSNKILSFKGRGLS